MRRMVLKTADNCLQLMSLTKWVWLVKILFTHPAPHDVPSKWQLMYLWSIPVTQCHSWLGNSMYELSAIISKNNSFTARDHNAKIFWIHNIIFFVYSLNCWFLIKIIGCYSRNSLNPIFKQAPEEIAKHHLIDGDKVQSEKMWGSAALSKHTQ